MLSVLTASWACSSTLIDSLIAHSIAKAKKSQVMHANGLNFKHQFIARENFLHFKSKLTT